MQPLNGLTRKFTFSAFCMKFIPTSIFLSMPAESAFQYDAPETNIFQRPLYMVIRKIRKAYSAEMKTVHTLCSLVQ
jgi:hypothetical protein